jgi:hypothetical protein
LASLLVVLQKSKDTRKRYLFIMVVALAALFGSFIALSGNTHALSALLFFYPDNATMLYTEAAMLTMSAMVATATAISSYWLFPLILEVLSKFELNSEGNLQHVENYLVEVGGDG